MANTYRQARKEWLAALRHVEWCARKSVLGSQVCTEALPRAKADLVKAAIRMDDLKKGRVVR